MKYLVYIFSAINLYAGIRFLLNAIGILQTSKYANRSNIFFAVVLITAGLGACYLSVWKGEHGYALIATAAPWGTTLVLLLVNMLFGDYK